MGVSKNAMKIHWQKTVGGVTGYSRLGRDYWRSVPNSVANPRTDAQQLVRAKMTKISQFLHQIDGIVNIGYAKYMNGQGMTNYNKAFKQVYHNALSGDTIEGLTIDPSKVLVSRGALTSVFVISATVAAATHTVSVNWSNNSGAGDAKATDKMAVVVYNSDKGITTFNANAAARSIESASLVYPDSWTGDTIYVYAFLQGDEANADSHYLGFFTA